MNMKTIVAILALASIANAGTMLDRAPRAGQGTIINGIVLAYVPNYGIVVRTGTGLLLVEHQMSPDPGKRFVGNFMRGADVLVPGFGKIASYYSLLVGPAVHAP